MLPRARLKVDWRREVSVFVVPPILYNYTYGIRNKGESCHRFFRRWWVFFSSTSSSSSSRFFQSLFLFLYTHATFSLSLYLSPSLLAAHGSYFYFIATVHHFAYSEIPTDNKYDFIHSIKKTPRLVWRSDTWRRMGFLYNKAWKTDGFIIVRMTRMAFYFV